MISNEINNLNRVLKPEEQFIIEEIRKANDQRVLRIQFENQIQIDSRFHQSQNILKILINEANKEAYDEIICHLDYQCNKRRKLNQEAGEGKTEEQIWFFNEKIIKVIVPKIEPLDLTMLPRFKLTMAINLNYEQLYIIFSRYGKIKSLIIGKNRTAVLEFKKLSDAIKCINNHENIKIEDCVDMEWLGY